MASGDGAVPGGAGGLGLSITLLSWSPLRPAFVPRTPRNLSCCVPTLTLRKPLAAPRRRCMSRPSYLSGRPEVPEPPSIAARRRNSNAATLQLQTTMVDPKHRVNPGATVLTPSPKTTTSTKSGDYFRASHGGAPPVGTFHFNLRISSS